eukprot:604878-Prorocentrum_minimum.AAC.1
MSIAGEVDEESKVRLRDRLARAQSQGEAQHIDMEGGQGEEVAAVEGGGEGGSGASTVRPAPPKVQSIARLDTRCGLFAKRSEPKMTRRNAKL